MYKYFAKQIGQPLFRNKVQQHVAVLKPKICSSYRAGLSKTQFIWKFFSSRNLDLNKHEDGTGSDGTGLAGFSYERSMIISAKSLNYGGMLEK